MDDVYNTKSQMTDIQSWGIDVQRVLNSQLRVSFKIYFI